MKKLFSTPVHTLHFLAKIKKNIKNNLSIAKTKLY